MLALVAPIDLPAGGSIRREKEVIKDQLVRNFCYAGDSCELYSSPYSKAAKLRHISLGTPLRIVRSWNSADGNTWLQVQVQSPDLTSLSSSKATRGWINV